MLKNNYNFERRQNFLENTMLKFEFLGNNENEEHNEEYIENEYEFLTNEYSEKSSNSKSKNKEQKKLNTI